MDEIIKAIESLEFGKIQLVEFDDDGICKITKVSEGYLIEIKRGSYSGSEIYPCQYSASGAVGMLSNNFKII